MEIRLALVEAEGQQFGLVVVEESILDHSEERESRRRLFEERVFKDIPVVLVGKNFLIEPRFFGPKPLTDHLEKVQMDMIEWTEIAIPLP